MFSFVIISNNPDIADFIKDSFLSIGELYFESDDRIVVRDKNDDWIAFQPILDPSDDYELDELEAIREKIHNPKFYLMEGRVSEFKIENRFFAALKIFDNTIVDNDHGAILNLQEIKDRIELGMEWLKSRS